MSSVFATTVLAIPATYPVNPQLTLAFQPKLITVENQSVNIAEVVFVSFDGIQDALILVPTKPSERWETRWIGDRRVWLRSASGAPSATVCVSA
jgi:hypothetical protein